ncbi:MAG: hypothetical protein EOM20_03335 [Spartobacteria bacterium]|nr:hypothetical protein [Spartobacteria bacterium]
MKKIVATFAVGLALAFTAQAEKIVVVPDDFSGTFVTSTAGAIGVGNTEITGTLDVSDVATFGGTVIAPNIDGYDQNIGVGRRAYYQQGTNNLNNTAIGYYSMRYASNTVAVTAFGAWAGFRADGHEYCGFIDAYTTQPASGHNPTNDLIFFEGGDLYLGRGGTTGKKIVLRNLPTSDPGEAGQLWQAGSNLYISTGP